jgi:hypothetical protein
MTTTETKPTPAAAWNGVHTVTITLPSGNVAELRERLPVYILLRTGVFTAEMFEAFNDWQAGQLSDPKVASELVDLIVVWMFINPKVTKDGADGTVALDQIRDDDIDHVLELASGGAPDPTFRDEPAGGDGGDHGADVAGDPVEPAGDAGGKPRRAQSRQSARRNAAGG